MYVRTYVRAFARLPVCTVARQRVFRLVLTVPPFGKEVSHRPWTSRAVDGGGRTADGMVRACSLLLVLKEGSSGTRSASGATTVAVDLLSLRDVRRRTPEEEHR